MARIPYVDPDDANVEPWVHEVVRAMGQGEGAPNVMRAVANHPGALRLVATAADAFYAQGLLPPDRRELAYIAASHTNACHYWVPTHVVLGRSIGISDAKLAHLGDDPLPDDVYTPAEGVAIRYAQRITRMEGIDDELYAELADHYSAAELVELCFVIGMSNLINRFHATFHTDVDEQTAAAVAGSCPLPIPPADRRARGGT